jgi:hypothetical protein
MTLKLESGVLLLLMVPVLFKETINLYRDVWLNWALLLNELTEEEEIYGHFVHGSSMAHTVNILVAAVREVFGK